MSDHINNFPPEIIREIFLRCLLLDSAAPSTRNAPLNLAAVCVSWRTLAHKTPDLWATLELRMQDCVSDVREILHYWNTLAGDRRLFLTLDFLCRYPAIKRDAILPPDVFPIISRAQHLNLRMNIGDQLFVLRRLNKDVGLPFLESLKLFVDSCRADIRDDHVWAGHTRLLPLCPDLRTLAIGSTRPPFDGIVPMERGLAVDAPWAQLTSLKIMEPRLISTHAVAILGQCLNLIECELSIGYGNTSTTWTPKDFILVHLTSFTVRASRWRGDDATRGVALVLDSFTLPVLEILNVSAGWTSRTVLLTSLLSLQQRSQFSLQKLSVMGIIDTEGLCIFFGCVPMLKSLSLHPINQSVYLSLLCLLQHKPSELTQFLLPNLVSLDLTVHTPGIYIDSNGTPKFQPRPLVIALQHQREVEERCKALISMVRSRFRNGEHSVGIQRVTPLELVTLRTWRGRNGPDFQEWESWITGRGHKRVEKLKREGLGMEFPVQVLDISDLQPEMAENL